MLHFIEKKASKSKTMSRLYAYCKSFCQEANEGEVEEISLTTIKANFEAEAEQLRSTSKKGLASALYLFKEEGKTLVCYSQYQAETQKLFHIEITKRHRIYAEWAIRDFVNGGNRIEPDFSKILYKELVLAVILKLRDELNLNPNRKVSFQPVVMQFTLNTTGGASLISSHRVITIDCSYESNISNAYHDLVLSALIELVQEKDPTILFLKVN
jgi:hypothetical protein